VAKSAKGLSFGVVGQLIELLYLAPVSSSIFIDIPIGLRDRSTSHRRCDRAARKLLGRPRSASVFPAPMRAVLRAPSYAAALAESRRLDNKGLSKKAFTIVPEIAEVDDLLTHDLRAREMLREVHPELCFWSFAGQRAMVHSKKTLAGFDERMAILATLLPHADAIVSDALNCYRRRDVARDDVVDALVVLCAAIAPVSLLRSIPAIAGIDSHGLAMEIVYAARPVDDGQADRSINQDR
jgi:predicted RNase H-like nuclease